MYSLSEHYDTSFVVPETHHTQVLILKGKTDTTNIFVRHRFSTIKFMSLIFLWTKSQTYIENGFLNFSITARISTLLQYQSH